MSIITVLTITNRECQINSHHTTLGSVSNKYHSYKEPFQQSTFSG